MSEAAKQNLDQYILEDRDTEACQNRTASKRIQQVVLKMLHDKLGLNQILSKVVQKELILQATNISQVSLGNHGT